MGGCIGINRGRRSGNDNSNENVSRPVSGNLNVLTDEIEIIYPMYSLFVH